MLGTKFSETLFVYDSAGVVKPVKDGDKIRVISPDKSLEFSIFSANNNNAYLQTTKHLFLQSAWSMYFDASDPKFYFTGAGHSMLGFYLSNTYAQATLFLYDTSGNQVVSSNNLNLSKDHDHILQTDPWWFYHSDTDPDTANDEWVGMGHNKTNPVLNWGSGELVLTDGALNSLTLTNAGALASGIVHQAQLASTLGEVSLAGSTGVKGIAMIAGGWDSVNDAIIPDPLTTTYITRILLVITDNAGANDASALRTLPGGEYGFYPQTKLTGGTIYAQQRYVTSSGEEHWIFLLVKKGTGEIVSGYSAPDHPMYGNGGDINEVPHPFHDIKPDEEVIIITMDETLALAKEKGKASFLTHIHENKKADMANEHAFIPRHTGQFQDKKPVKIDTLPPGIKVRSLIAK